MLSRDIEIYYFNNNLCVACGDEIPEGFQICKNCVEKEKVNYNDKILHRRETNVKFIKRIST